jgi:hypothetical protein
MVVFRSQGERSKVIKLALLMLFQEAFAELWASDNVGVQISSSLDL